MVAHTEFIGPAQGGLEPAKSKRSRPPGLRRLQPDRQRLVHHAVAVHKSRGGIVAVRHLVETGAHLRRGADAKLRDRFANRFVAIAVENRAEPFLADTKRRLLRLHIADALVGDADVRADDRVDLGVQNALLEKLDRRQAQPLLLHRRRRGGETARHRAADIRPVPGI